jgi:hypothetical protein
MRAAMMASMLPLWGAPTNAQMIPEVEDFRQQTISRQAGESGWPFVAQSGVLSCVYSLGQKFVFFVPEGDATLGDEDEAADESETGVINVTTDPILLLVQQEQSRLLVPGLTIEEKIRRLGPYVSLGKKLCEQPMGTIVGPGEL